MGKVFNWIVDPIGTGIASAIGFNSPADYAFSLPTDYGAMMKQDWTAFKHLLVPDMRRDREAQIATATYARNIVYGRTRVGNILVYAESSGAKNEILHVICVHAGHEIDGFEEIYFNDKLVCTAAGGWAIQAPFTGKATIERFDGTQTAACSSMVAASAGGWTNNHKLLGVAYTHVTLTYDEAAYPAGIPTIKAVIRGKKVLDPRTGLIAWSDNPMLCIADYMRLPVKYGGMGCDADEIAAFLAQADICDEQVMSYIPPDQAPGVKTTYKPVVGVDPLYPETRYTLNGEIRLDGAPTRFIASMLTACAGEALYAGGEWHLFVGAPSASVATIDESWLNGGISFNAGANNNDKVNTAKGTFTNSNDFWVDSEFPPVPFGRTTPPNSVYWTVSSSPAQYNPAITYAVGQIAIFVGKAYKSYNAVPLDKSPPDSSYWVLVEEYDAGVTYPPNYVIQRAGVVYTSISIVPAANAYLAEDGGELLTANLVLPFTITSSEAQRLAKIALEKSRRGLTVSYPCNHRAFPFDVMDVIAVNNTRLGWNAKLFRVISWSFSLMTGTALSLQEYDAAIYDWVPGDSTPLVPPLLTNLPDPWHVAKPVNLSVVESLYRGNTPGLIMTKAFLTWDASDAQSSLYDIYLDDIYQFTSREKTIELRDIAPGLRKFSVQAMNSIGSRSDFADYQFYIFGKTAPPADVTNFYATPVITGGVRFSWQPVADLDVQEYIIKHSPLTAGADWFGASLVIRSNATYANLNAVQTGTYFIKAIDTSLNFSVAPDSLVITTVPSNIGLTPHTLIEESPTWGGTKTNLTLTAGELVVSGTGTDFILGTYEVGTVLDFGSLQTVRVKAQCDWRTEAQHGSFDSIASIDGMDGWDNPSGKSNVQAYIWTSQNSSAPTFKQPLFAGDYTFQRAKFTLEATEFIPDLVTVTSLIINVDLHDTVITI